MAEFLEDFPTVTRDQAVAALRLAAHALVVELPRLERGRLARECAKLDPDFEQRLADEGLVGEARSRDPG